MKLHTALTIAGTDPSGGAGIMADLKSFQSRNVYGMAVVTSVVAQNTTGVHHVEHLSLESIDRQLHDVYSDIEPQAVYVTTLEGFQIGHNTSTTTWISTSNCQCSM